MRMSLSTIEMTLLVSIDHNVYCASIIAHQDYDSVQ
jgi:hypothetical protein